MSLYFDCAINSGSSSGNIHINTTWHTSHALLAVRRGCHYPFPMTIIIIDRWAPTRRRGEDMSPSTLTMVSQRRTSASPHTPQPKLPPPPGIPPGTVMSQIDQIPSIFGPWNAMNTEYQIFVLKKNTKLLEMVNYSMSFLLLSNCFFFDGQIERTILDHF